MEKNQEILEKQKQSDVSEEEDQSEGMKQDVYRAKNEQGYLQSLCQQQNQELIRKLKQSGFTVHPHSNEHIKILIVKTQQQLVKLEVQVQNISTNLTMFYGRFPLQLLEKKLQIGSGRYGQIFKVKINRQHFIVKDIGLQSEQHNWNFFNMIVKEVFMLKLASALQVGPHFQSLFGFDFLYLSNLVSFAMEDCSFSNLEANISAQKLSKDLKKCLAILHSFKIIHGDIKPENIGWSQHKDSFIFLDFGITHIICENVGQKTMSSFQGSFEYSSPEMKKSFILKQQMPVDLYYNDIFGLEATITFLGKSSIIKQKFNRQCYHNFELVITYFQILYHLLDNNYPQAIALVVNKQIMIKSVRKIVYQRKLKDKHANKLYEIIVDKSETIITQQQSQITEYDEQLYKHIMTECEKDYVYFGLNIKNLAYYKDDSYLKQIWKKNKYMGTIFEFLYKHTFQVQDLKTYAQERRKIISDIFNCCTSMYPSENYSIRFVQVLREFQSYFYEQKNAKKLREIVAIQNMLKDISGMEKGRQLLVGLIDRDEFIFLDAILDELLLYDLMTFPSPSHINQQILLEVQNFIKKYNIPVAQHQFMKIELLNLFDDIVLLNKSMNASEKEFDYFFCYLRKNSQSISLEIRVDIIQLTYVKYECDSRLKEKSLERKSIQNSYIINMVNQTSLIEQLEKKKEKENTFITYYSPTTAISGQVDCFYTLFLDKECRSIKVKSIEKIQRIVQSLHFSMKNSKNYLLVCLRELYLSTAQNVSLHKKKINNIITNYFQESIVHLMNRLKNKKFGLKIDFYHIFNLGKLLHYLSGLSDSSEYQFMIKQFSNIYKPITECLKQFPQNSVNYSYLVWSQIIIQYFTNKKLNQKKLKEVLTATTLSKLPRIYKNFILSLLICFLNRMPGLFQENSAFNLIFLSNFLTDHHQFIIYDVLEIQPLLQIFLYGFFQQYGAKEYFLMIRRFAKNLIKKSHIHVKDYKPFSFFANICNSDLLLEIMKQVYQGISLKNLLQQQLFACIIHPIQQKVHKMESQSQRIRILKVIIYHIYKVGPEIHKKIATFAYYEFFNLILKHRKAKRKRKIFFTKFLHNVRPQQQEQVQNLLNYHHKYTQLFSMTKNLKPQIYNKFILKKLQKKRLIFNQLL